MRAQQRLSLTSWCEHDSWKACIWSSTRSLGLFSHCASGRAKLCWECTCLLKGRLPYVSLKSTRIRNNINILNRFSLIFAPLSWILVAFLPQAPLNFHPWKPLCRGFMNFDYGQGLWFHSEVHIVLVCWFALCSYYSLQTIWAHWNANSSDIAGTEGVGYEFYVISLFGQKQRRGSQRSLCLKFKWEQG